MGIRFLLISIDKKIYPKSYIHTLISLDTKKLTTDDLTTVVSFLMALLWFNGEFHNPR